ncbi:Protein bric-a-brac 1 [Sarcoptes scabiei]|nr:Protein bric-a-brac 1 [Sarcoptes scabiei]
MKGYIFRVMKFYQITRKGAFETKNFITNHLLTFEILYERRCFDIVAIDTEIDWSTYMQQVQCFLNGTLNYENISGNTGPIVYPAGHLYVYSLLYSITEKGSNIRKAQYIFATIYLLTIMTVFRLYRKCSKIPPYVLIFMCCTSYRAHSIYILRLFNDVIAMFFLYLSMLMFINQRWNLGSIIYSLAVSIKMNILLFAPALFLLFNEFLSKKQLIRNLFQCASVQIILALPFLSTHPVSYLRKAFELNRVFLHKWTVNYRFLDENIFVNRYFHLILLLLHISMLILMFRKRWVILLQNLFKTGPIIQSRQSLDSRILMTMFVSNFIGVAFSRSLHYQFYIWYYHSLPFLIWNLEYKTPTKICILGLIEFVWNVYPSTAWSSALLHLIHLSILIGLLRDDGLQNFNIGFDDGDRDADDTKPSIVTIVTERRKKIQ